MAVVPTPASLFGGCTTNPPRSTCFACSAFVESEWEALANDDVSILDRAKVTRHYAPGEVVFEEGAPASEMFCIGAGVVCLQRQDWRGRPVPLALRYPGDTLGVLAIVFGQRYGTTAVTVERSRICGVDGDTVRLLLSRGVNLPLAFLGRLASRMERAEMRLLSRKSLPVRAQVAQLLVDLTGEHGVPLGPRGVLLRLPLAPSALALAIGIEPPVMDKVLAELEKNGLIASRGHTLVVPDHDRLIAEARSPSPA